MSEPKKQIPKSPIRAMLARPVAFHPVLARLCGSVTAGLMLSQAIYWSERTEDPDGWFWKSQDDWTREICLSRWEQEGAREQVETLGFLETSRRGVGARLYFRVNFERLEEAIRQNEEIPHSGMRKNRILKCGNSSLRKNRNPESGKTTSRNEEKPQSEMRKNHNPSLLDSLTTAETTSETTSSSPEDLARIAEALSEFCRPDDDGVRSLVRNCRQVRPDATVTEILHFIRVKGALALSERVCNPFGLLLKVIPPCFEGASFAIARRECQRLERMRKITCHWCQYEYSTDGEQCCPNCRAAPDSYHAATNADQSSGDVEAHEARA